MVFFVTSSPQGQWIAGEFDTGRRAQSSVGSGDTITHDFKGFGGCFNELGWKALAHLGDNARNEVLEALFGERGCGFSYCRLPIGASDYAESWYSHNETADDFAMESFSIDRDRQALLPYIEAARAASAREFYLFASPWSPPTWMKRPQAHNFGTLVWEPKYRRAYAEYFVRFVQAYEKVGVPINAVHLQNEPNSDQKFPSCLWTGAKMRDFIRDDLGPAFERAKLKTEIWAGTIERGDFNAWAGAILSDPAAAAYVKGLGFQWAGKYGVQRTRQAYPEVPIIQTENECGDGENTWDYAHYVFDLAQHYLSNGAEAYVYWNMVLEPHGQSTWGWKQNSMITVDPESRTAVYNPEYHVMRHFAGFVKPGASVLRTVGHWAANTVAFHNPDGSTVHVIQNPFSDERIVSIGPSGKAVTVTLAPRSISTLVN